jgi:prepilin-type N-terminal cleavage/methylation domain-containing protein
LGKTPGGRKRSVAANAVFGGGPLRTTRAKSGGRDGFTLVEVIVVLVILAILAAIAIPALTGYIDKANEKEWIAHARNDAIAIRSVIAEAYAEGTFGAGLSQYSTYADFLSKGETFLAMKQFNVGYVSYCDMKMKMGSAYSDWCLYYRKAAELTGTAYPSVTDPTKTKREPGYWEIYYYAPAASDYTIFDAPAFRYVYCPEGWIKGNPVTFVTYDIGGLSDTVQTVTEFDTMFQSNAAYKPGAGYKVFHVTEQRDAFS